MISINELDLEGMRLCAISGENLESMNGLRC